MASKRITFKYKFSQDYNPKIVNGAYGGFNEKGELVVNFYFERIPIPYTQTYEVSEKGKLIQESVKTEPEEFEFTRVRMVENGIAMTIDSARIIAGWLNTKLEEYDELMKKIKEREDK